MKKIVKLLTLALSLVLIFGVMSLAIFADEDTIKRTSLYTEKFNVGVAKSAASKAEAPAANFSIITCAGRSGFFTISEGGMESNKYLTYSHSAVGVSGITSNNGAHTYKHVDGSTPTANAGFTYSFDDVDYYVFDFDIMTPEDNNYATDVGVVFMHYIYEDDGNGSPVVKNGFGESAKVVVVGSAEEGFFLQTVAGDKAPLPAVAGEWNHVTYAVKIDHSTKADGSFNFSKSTGTLWINGVKVLDNEVAGISSTWDNPAKYFNNDPDYGGLRHFRLIFPTTKSNGTETTAIDNIEVSVYGAGTTATVDEIGNAVYQNGANRPKGDLKASITSGETKVDYDRLGDAFAALKDGDVLQLHADVTTETVVDKLVTIKYTDGEKTYDVSKISSTIYMKEEADEGGAFSFIEADNADVTIYWADCLHDPYCGDVSDELMATNHPYYVEGTALIGNAPIHPNPELLPPASRYEDGKLINFVGWAYSEDATEPDDLVAVTEDDLLDGISLFPVYEIAEVAFYVESGENVTYYDATANFVSIVNEAKTGDKVVLTSDIEITSVLQVKAGFTLDLNGYTFSSVCYTQNTVEVGKTNTIGWGTKNQMFNVTTEETFTLTSSKPGAVISEAAFITHKDANGDRPDVAPILGGMGVFYAAAGYDVDIVINGENLSIYCCSLYANRANNGGGSLTLNGGYYNCSVEDQNGLIYTYVENTVPVVITAKDAFFTNTSARHIINAFEKSDLQANFTNCTFYSPNSAGITSASDKVVMTFTDCDIFAPITVVPGNMKLGIGTRVGAYEDATAAAGASIIEASGSTTVNYKTIPYTKDLEELKFAEGAYVESTEVKNVSWTYEVVKEVKFVTVTWVDPDGNVLATTEVPENSVANIPAVANIAYDGWRGLQITKWTVDGETQSDLKVGSEDVTFKALVLPSAEDEDATFVANMTGMKFNYKFVSHWQITYYFPVDANVTVTDFNINGTGRMGALGNVNIDAVAHKKASVWPGASGVLNGITSYIVYEIDGQSYRADFVIDTVDYAKTVIDEIEDATAAEKTMVADLVNYVYRACGATNAKSAQFVADYADYLSKDDAYKAYTLPEAVGNINDYVSSVAYFVTSGTGGAGFQINLTDAAKSAGVVVSAARLENNAAYAVTKQSNGDYRTAHNVAISNHRAGLIITIKDAEGNVLASAGFDMKTLIAGLAEGATKEQYKAFYNFANSTANFKAY